VAYPPGLPEHEPHPDRGAPDFSHCCS
jgi:hypothetical protein